MSDDTVHTPWPEVPMGFVASRLGLVAGDPVRYVRQKKFFTRSVFMTRHETEPKGDDTTADWPQFPEAWIKLHMKQLKPGRRVAFEWVEDDEGLSNLIWIRTAFIKR